jgi:hypothetical protein
MGTSKEKTTAATGSQKKSKKKTGGQGTVRACETVSGVRSGMQIWVKTLTGQVGGVQGHQVLRRGQHHRC